ncbi:hypothetical protein EAH83_06185 [Variovorax ginsengisoli]|uniref:Uncharacterized protein n=1 Tax=Variovorax guangxiensis TaxID=1775474 RepID=A0A502DEL6_9BURK|nr:hypothetical protein EAH82_20535 [Variovorax guangxiensis]TPG24087.1 hypothetical protein EAH83_06185 [Variovorax ginsengisoli]
MALGNLVVRACYRSTKQPATLRPIFAPLVFSNSINAGGLCLAPPEAWTARPLLEELKEKVRMLLAEDLYISGTPHRLRRWR